MNNVPTRRPSTGYSLSLIIAALGVTCVTVALAGALYLRGGRDPVDAAGLPGQLAFASSFGLLFASRWVFAESSSDALRQRVRGAISAVLVLEVILALVGTALVLASQRPSGLFLAIFTALALTCQAGTLLWLFRYRTE